MATPSSLEGRAAVLDARLGIYSVNFGEASRHFETLTRAVIGAYREIHYVRQKDGTQ